MTATLSGEVPARNRSNGYSSSVSLISSDENPAMTRFRTALESGEILLESQPGGVAILDRYYREDLDVAGGPVATTNAGHDSAAWLGDPNDTIARLVLEHQEEMDSLIALTSDITRNALFDEATKGSTWDKAASEAQKRFEKPAEDLLRALLFAGEAELTSPIQEKSGFQGKFEQLGPFDRRGRTLRDLDLQTRIFRYPCSYVIYSDEWEALAEPAKSYLYHRLHELLTGQGQNHELSRLTPDVRRAILAILLDTKPDLPSEWKQSPGQRRHAKAELGRIRVLAFRKLSRSQGVKIP